MPQILQFVSYFLPLRYYLTIIRSLMLKENGLIGLQDEIIALIIFGFAFLTIASLRFKKRLD
jgi:ABC-2 type transport system permease protein